MIGPTVYIIFEGDSGSATEKGGRKPVYLSINKNFGCIVGIEVQPDFYNVSAITFNKKEIQNIEKVVSEKLGKKVFITGKGRCNVTNACATEDLFNNIIVEQNNENEIQILGYKEYEKIKNFNYLEYCDYLQNKYGIGLSDYMTKGERKALPRLLLFLFPPLSVIISANSIPHLATSPSL